MAETFICKGEQVHFTNGGCHELYLTWSKCAEKLQFDDLAEVLIGQTNLGWGFAADGIDENYLSDDFNTEERKTQFLKVMDLLIAEIETHGSIAEEMDVNWDDELRIYWIEKLKRLRDALHIQINV